MKILEIKTINKDDFVKTNRLFETIPEEIEQDWKRYKQHLSELKKNERERKIKRKLRLISKDEFVNSPRLFETSDEQIEKDWLMCKEYFDYLEIKKKERLKKKK